VNGGRSFLLTNASFMWGRSFQIQKEKRSLHSLKGYNITHMVVTEGFCIYLKAWVENITFSCVFLDCNFEVCSTNVWDKLK